MATVTANGIRIEYESFGSNDAPVIVLIMGLGMQLIAWPDPFCEKLAAAGFRVIRFDNRDIGLSTYFDDRGVPNLVWQFIKARIGLRIRAHAYCVVLHAISLRRAMKSQRSSSEPR